MKCNKKKENVDLMLDEVDKPIDKALFIISNVYYCIRYFYHDKYIDSNLVKFPNYLNSFKNKFNKKAISTKFSFNLIDKSSFFDKSLDDISDKNMDNSSKEEIYYDLLYKRLINIINEEMYFNQEEYIEPIISLRNCFIFMEYLYLFLKKYPNKINHYIIKIDISLLLDIIQRISRKLINSNEFYYLNLIELKGLFPEIEYSPSSFIISIDKIFRIKYLDNLIELKSKKLIILESQLSNLLDTLGKFYSNENSILYEKINKILENLSNEPLGSNKDILIEKYILSTNKNKKMTLKEILDEIKFQNNIIPEFNYLYLIALNNFNELQKENDNKVNHIIRDENGLNNNKIINDKNNIFSKDENKIDIISGNEKLISTTKDINEKAIKKNKNIPDNEKENDTLKQKKDYLIDTEELILKINSIKENLLDLKSEEENNYENKYEEYIYRNFTYNRVLNLEKDNIYNILIFKESKKIKQDKNITNLDDAYIKYKNKYISFIEDINSIDYKMFYDIISDKNFHEEIITILKSEPILKYLTENGGCEEVKDNDENRNKKSYEFKFDENGEPHVENPPNEYYKLMEKLNDNLFFINLFRLKYLPFGIKAFVNYNLKIIVNSLYYKFNENIVENNKKIIFKAALKILIIHEIMHILKYLKNEISFNEMPKTPKKREAGKMLINYLFGKPTIKSINLDEAEKINDCNNWKDITKLQKIFPNDNEPIENNSIIKNVDCLDLYYTEDDIEENNIKKVKIYEDIGIDID